MVYYYYSAKAEEYELADRNAAMQSLMMSGFPMMHLGKCQPNATEVYLLELPSCRRVPGHVVGKEPSGPVCFDLRVSVSNTSLLHEYESAMA